MSFLLAITLISAVWAAPAVPWERVPDASSTIGARLTEEEAPLASTDPREKIGQTSSLVDPSPRGYHAMTYDAKSDRFILFGGQSQPGPPNLEDTWAFDLGGNNWTNRMPSPSPPPAAVTMVYHIPSDRAVLLKGNPATDRLDAWAYHYDLNSWTVQESASAPVPRNGWRIAYDTQSDRIILFGGVRNFVAMNDTWAFDFKNNTWTKMSPAISPPGRNWHRMVYDSVSDRIIMFGGSVLDNQTWAYDYEADSWNSLGSAGAPSPRIYHDMVYDPQPERIVLFGGVDYPSEVPRNDTWIYDLGWQKVATNDGPSPRGWHAMAFMPQSRRVVLFGGGPDRNSFTQETWLYDMFRGSWTALDVPATDTVRPSITITSPEAGATVTSRAVTIIGTASDDVALAKVDVSTDESNWAPASGTTTWSATVMLSLGANIVFARATDTAGNTQTESVALTFADVAKPSISLTSPDDGSIVTFGSVNVAGSASDDIALLKVEIGTDGTNWLPVSGTTAWSASIILGEGPNTIYARAVDTSGNIASTSVSVTVVTSPSRWIYVGVATGLAAAAVGVGLLLLRRKRVS